MGRSYGAISPRHTLCFTRRQLELHCCFTCRPATRPFSHLGGWRYSSRKVGNASKTSKNSDCSITLHSLGCHKGWELEGEAMADLDQSRMEVQTGRLQESPYAGKYSASHNMYDPAPMGVRRTLRMQCSRNRSWSATSVKLKVS